MPCITEGHLHKDICLQSLLGNAMHDMQSSLLHGISDERGCYDCLYIIFSSKKEINTSMLDAMEILVPYLDTALRRVKPLLPSGVTGSLADSRKYPGLKEYEAELDEAHGLSKREAEIMDWVKMGKTNGEIGSILGISPFTVKNHLQNIFKKLEVYNRIQAVSKRAEVKPD